MTAADPDRATAQSRAAAKARALKFVLLVGAMSFFADFTYEGMRGIAGPYLALLGASATAVGVVSGLGELLGYGLRVVSGRLSDRTGQFWPITITGYVVQMVAVPSLALAGSWPMAAALIVLERVGKAIRNPPRDVMLSHAAGELGYGWVFGLHEALDQLGALSGPLVIAAVLALHGDYQTALAWLAVPAALTLAVLGFARWAYPRPEEMAVDLPDVHTEGIPPVFWIYLAAAGLVAMGFADFPLIAYHFAQQSVVSIATVPIFYAVAMGVSGLASLVFGRLFDRRGIGILIPLTIVSVLFAPLAFLGNAWVALAGVGLWGMAMGVHESIIPAAVATMVPRDRRASAYGLFTAGFGIAWFVGSAVMGLLYDVAFPALIVFSIAAQLAAVPFLVAVRRRLASNGERPAS
jgi:predicted MFS family arabinose efflux permease